LFTPDCGTETLTFTGGRGRMSRRRLDGRSGLAAGLLGEIQTLISTEPLESVYEITGELGR